MMRIAFIGPQRKLIRFSIDGKIIRYFDDNWKGGIQIYPLSISLVNKLVNASSPNLKAMGLLIFDANNGTNLEEYNSCKTEEELANFIRKDCSLKGLSEVTKK